MPELSYLLLLAPFGLYGLGVWHGYTTARKERTRHGGNRPGPASQTSEKEWT